MNEEPDDETEFERPSEEDVCARILALGATLWRAQLELHLQREATEPEVLAERLSDLQTWMQQNDSSIGLSASETELHELPLGEWDDSQLFETMWRFEALALLLWATRHLDEMPSWLEPVDGHLVIQKSGVLQDTDRFYADSALREQADLARGEEAAEFWCWRFRTEMMRRDGVEPPPGQTYEETVASALNHAVEQGIVTETADGDVSVNGVAYSALSQDEWAPIASISIERHYAGCWLAGYAPENDWDQTRVDT